MEHKLSPEPSFDFDTFRAKVSAWKAAGSTTLRLEWSTGSGPVVFYFPDGQRKFGASWKSPVSPTRYSEAYADFLEHKLVPQLIESARGNGLDTKALCVDQQPVQVMRQRRREIEKAEHAIS